MKICGAGGGCFLSFTIQRISLLFKKNSGKTKMRVLPLKVLIPFSKIDFVNKGLISGKKNIAGMSMKGGRKDNFFFCLLEYFPKKKKKDGSLIHFFRSKNIKKMKMIL